jgi:hypothetical protein
MMRIVTNLMATSSTVTQHSSRILNSGCLWYWEVIMLEWMLMVLIYPRLR